MRLELHPRARQTLADQLHAAGIEFPCGGEIACGGCRVRVLEGEVPITAAMREALSEKDLRDGWRLACCASAAGCVTVEVEQWSLHALTDEARHSYEAQAAAYRNTIFQAFNDVEDQLSGLRILERESDVEQRAVESAQHSVDLSNQRYQGGVTSYLEVLTSEGVLLQNQRTAIDLQTRQFVASVGLVRALGGGWDTRQLPK